jgi:hypothetical protein
MLDLGELGRFYRGYDQLLDVGKSSSCNSLLLPARPAFA